MSQKITDNVLHEIYSLFPDLIPDDSYPLDDHVNDAKLVDFYPTQERLSMYSERKYPSMHYYFCFGKKQVFMRYLRGVYYLSIRGMVPVPSQEKAGFFNVLKTSEFTVAQYHFRQWCSRILDGEV